MKNVKTLLAVALSTVSIMGLAACGTSADTSAPSVNSSEPDTVVSAPVENTEEQVTPEELPEHIYESEGFTLYFSSEETEGALTAVDITAGIVSDSAGNVFYTDSGDRLHSEKEVSEYVIAQNEVYYKNASGYTVIVENGNEYLCSDIKGDIFYAFKGMLNSSLYVMSVDDKGAMYLNSFKASGLKDGLDNEPLYIYDYKDESFTKKVDKLAVTDTLNPSIYIEADGKVFYSAITGTMKVQGNQCLHFGSLDYTFDKVFDFGFNHQFTSPLYSKNDNDTKLYFKDGWSADEFAVNLPDGYKVSDIKDAIFAYSTVITMNDGTVWTGETQYTVLGTDLTKHEKLSEISDHIVSLHPSNLTGDCSVMAIMDDNKIYKATLG